MTTSETTPETVPLHYHASHEQFGPAALRELAVAAARAGFDGIASSDHLAPWSVRTGVAGGAWVWLPAVMAATSVPFSVVTTPGYRYPPLVLAQSIATCADLFPGRLSVALGSGEALNEALVADWPEKEERNRRLREHTERIHALLHDDVPVSDPHRLYAPPEVPPPLSVAAVTVPTARWIGGWWDAMATIGDTVAATRERLDAFRQARGDRGRVTVKLQLSVADSVAASVAEAAREWRPALVGPDELAELRTPADFERASARIPDSRVREVIPPVTSLAELEDVLAGFAELEPDLIVVHDVAPQQAVLGLMAERFPLGRPAEGEDAVR